MRLSPLFAACLLASSLAAAQAPDPAMAHARKLLKAAILIDGHNDLPFALRKNKDAQGRIELYDLRGHTSGDTDIARLRAGGVGGQFWSVYIPGETPDHQARMQLEQIEMATRIIQRYPDTFAFARTAADIRAAHRARKIASLLGMEGGHSIENSLGALRAYYSLGVRYMTLTHNVHTDWADSAALPPIHGGLTPFGEQVVLEMNRLGMLVDLAHVAPETMDDALRVSKAPVIFSHSSARALCDIPRNVPDDILQRVTANGGVVMVTFVDLFINPAVVEYQKAGAVGPRPKTTIAQVADHVEHVRDVAGIEHVGLGGDYDGNPNWPEGMEDVSSYPLLFAELIRRGWSDRDLTLLAGGNVLRALEQAEALARSMKDVPAGSASLP